MGNFQVRYASRVVIYDRRAIIRLATGVIYDRRAFIRLAVTFVNAKIRKTFSSFNGRVGL